MSGRGLAWLWVGPRARGSTILNLINVCLGEATIDCNAFLVDSTIDSVSLGRY